MMARTLIVSVSLLVSSHIAHAAPFTDITGWAWSDNIGWISYSCLNTGTCGTVSYGLRRDSAGGVIDGYAWSDNVGWISAMPAHVGSGCPPSSGPCEFRMQNSGRARGWMRVVADGAGWDGWIHMGDTNETGTDAYGLQYTYGALTGYGWGDQVVGWIFSAADLPCSSFQGNLCDRVWKYRDTETIIAE